MYRYRHVRLERWLRPMVPRDPREEHRGSTPLELFFDLCFVAAVALLADSLHHSLTEGNVLNGVVRYCAIFFAIWWAWMNFTWFASAYDTDDAPYRFATLIQMVGVLVLAAGVPRAFENGDFLTITLGYLIMRLALIGQWFRAAYSDPPRRRTAYRYIAGLALAQFCWILLLLVPLDYRLIGFVPIAAIELLVPVWAERVEPTTWHPAHIAERYGLFTLIVLGESVISTTRAFQVSHDAGDDRVELLSLALAAVVIIFGIWWLYFDRQTHEHLTTVKRAFIWGYGHWFIFAAIAANGAGLAAAIDYWTGQSQLNGVATGYAIAIPVALFILGVWYLQVVHYETGRGSVVFLGAAALVLASPVLGLGIYAIAALMAILVVFDMLVQPGAALGQNRDDTS